MTQTKINFIIIVAKILTGVVCFTFLVVLIFQFITLNNIKNEKLNAQYNLEQMQLLEKQNNNKLNYLRENYNQFLDDYAKDNLGLLKDNQTKIMPY